MRMAAILDFCLKGLYRHFGQNFASVLKTSFYLAYCENSSFCYNLGKRRSFRHFQNFDPSKISKIRSVFQRGYILGILKDFWGDKDVHTKSRNKFKINHYLTIFIPIKSLFNEQYLSCS